MTKQDITLQSFLNLTQDDEAYSVRPINLDETKDFILKIHYAHRMPPVSYCYGLIFNGLLVGVVTYGMPASNQLCRGICGDDHKANVLELNRLCLLNNKKNEASMLVSRSLRLLPKPMIIVSYADTAQGHTGFVYQACNFIFTGTTKERTDIASEEGKHARHHLGDLSKRQKRSSKHRYIYFLGSKKQVKDYKACLRYPVQSYPKPTPTK